MALSRKFLTALGLEGDKVDEIITAHSETVDALKEERDNAKKEAEGYKTEAEKYKAEAEKIPALQEKVESLEKTIEDAENNKNEDAWKVKYDAIKEERDKLQSDFDSFKKDVSAKETKASKEKAYRSLLKEAGVSEKRFDSIIRVTDLNKIELDEEGHVKDSAEIKESIKTDWADFIPTISEKGADIANPPANTGGTTKTKSEIMAIKDRAERQKAIADNPKLFGIEE